MSIQDSARVEDRAAPSIAPPNSPGRDPQISPRVPWGRLVAASIAASLVEIVLLWRLMLSLSPFPWLSGAVALLLLTPLWLATAIASAGAGRRFRGQMEAGRPLLGIGWSLLALAGYVFYLQLWTSWLRTKSVPLGTDGFSAILTRLPVSGIDTISAMLLFLLGVFATWFFATGARSRTRSNERASRSSIPRKAILPAALLGFACSGAVLTGTFDFDTTPGAPSWKHPDPVLSIASGLLQPRLFRLEASPLGPRTAELIRIQRDVSASDQVLVALNKSELTPIDPSWAPPAPTVGNRPPIIFFKIDSLRADVIGLQIDGVTVMPELTRLATRGVRFTRAYSPSTSTERSDPAILSSLYPLRSSGYQQYAANDPWPKTMIYDALHKAGYATAIFSAGDLSWCEMETFLKTPGLDHLFDGKQGTIPAYMSKHDLHLIDDQQTLDRAFEWMEKPIQEKRPFFAWLDLQSPHFPYEIGPDAPHPFNPSTLNFFIGFYQFPVEKAPIVRNAYLNGLREADRQLGRLVKRLAEARLLDDTILAIYGDHGEAFFENGQVTHAGDPFEPTVHVGFILHSPARLKPRTEDYPVELIDLVPTVFARMNWPRHPNFQGRDVLSSLRPSLEERAVFCRNSTRMSQADAVILAGRWKYFDKAVTRRHALYDLAEDPAETEDASEKHPEIASHLQQLLSKWRRNQLAYYQQPVYYRSYYPPASPR